MAFEQRQLGEPPLDAFVHVSQALLEPENLFAYDGKAEVAGSMMPACTGPTGISWTPSPSTCTNA